MVGNPRLFRKLLQHHLLERSPPSFLHRMAFQGRTMDAVEFPLKSQPELEVLLGVVEAFLVFGGELVWRT